MRCFAYGSNLSSARMRQRVPSARFVTVAMLPAHRLRFHKIGRDDSAKCDAAWSGNSDDCVIGVVYEFDAAEKPALDRAEGLGAGYEEKAVELRTPQGKLDALMYYATKVDDRMKPYRWYREHVLIGARERRLPRDYVARIAAVEAIDDPDVARSERELAIYR